jgi:hypothetical protein
MQAPAAFDHIPPTAAGHFLLHFYAAVDRLIACLRRLTEVAGKDWADVSERYPFIGGYLAEIYMVTPEQADGAETGGWWEDTIAGWEAEITEHLPLRALGAAHDGFTSCLALVLAGVVEEDSRFGTLFADMQAPLPHRRPCVETIGQALRGGEESGAGWAICQPLLRANLLAVANRDAPRAEWALRVPAPLWEIVRGHGEDRPASWCRIHPPGAVPALADLILPAAERARLAQLPALLRDGQVSALVLRGMQGSERLEVVGAIARALDRGIVEVAQEDGPPGATPREEERRALLGPLCLLTRSLPVFSYDLGPGETVELAALPGYAGPIGVLLGFEGGLRGALAEHALTLALPLPGADLRLRHWRLALGEHAGPDLPAIAERFHLPGGYIRQAGALAVAQAALAGRATVRMDDVRAAGQALNRQLLDSLAARVDAGGTWEHLVVCPPTEARLRELELRCRHRERLLDHLGPAFGASANRGVRALFSGSSGTGKTLAARVLAAELGMDLYRVDLSAVVNKYIGETEKNLHRVLSRAEELDVVLLLDEGDALLGSRTEVKSANDRYANLETNFLLQRLEVYQGIVVVTTNAGQLIDRAFQRRLDVVVNFVPPQADERHHIWRLHLPDDHLIPDDALDAIAARYALTGGQIRNAALLATLLALHTGDRLRLFQVEEAIENEYRKANAIVPLAEDRPADGWSNGVTNFLNALG